MITVHLPADLAAEFQAPPTIVVEGRTTCAEILEALNHQYPGMSSWLAESDGRFREHLSVFLSGRRLAPRALTRTELGNATDMWILRAVSGG